MKTVYIARSIIPSQSANSIHVMKISEAFNELCERFELIVPESENDKAGGDLFDYYGVKSTFPIFRIRQKKYLKGFYRYYFAFKALWLILQRKADIIITREPLVAFFAVLLRKHTVLDLHGELAHLCGRAYRIIKLRSFRDSKFLNIVMITESLVRYYEKKYGLNPDKITVLPDGCTLENFEPFSNQPLFQKEELRLAYAGSLGVGRGYEIIQQMAEENTNASYLLYGGTREDAKRLTGMEPPQNIAFKGFIANRDIPKALCQQDVLLLPYQNTLIAKGEDTGKVMSPLKLFEYMASGRVIVASDLQVLREILNESNCYFAIADDVNSWKQVIEYIVTHKEEAAAKAQKAKEDVKQYTWKIRARRMLELCQ